MTSERVRALAELGLGARAAAELSRCSTALERATFGELKRLVGGARAPAVLAFPVVHVGEAYPITVEWRPRAEVTEVPPAVADVAAVALRDAWDDSGAVVPLPDWAPRLGGLARVFGLDVGGHSVYLACYLAALHRATGARLRSPGMIMATGRPDHDLDQLGSKARLLDELPGASMVALGVHRGAAPARVDVVETRAGAAERVFGYMPVHASERRFRYQVWTGDEPTEADRAKVDDLGRFGKFVGPGDLAAIVEAVQLTVDRHKRIDLYVKGPVTLAAALGCELRTCQQVRFVERSGEASWVNANVRDPHPERGGAGGELRLIVSKDAVSVDGWEVLAPWSAAAMLQDVEGLATEVLRRTANASHVRLGLNLPVIVAAAIGHTLRNVRSFSVHKWDTKEHRYEEEPWYTHRLP